MGDSDQAGPSVVEFVGLTEVVQTIPHSGAPSTRKLYSIKWKLFTSRFRDRQLDPVNCLIGTVLEFLQERFSTEMFILHGALSLRPALRTRLPA